MKDPHRLLGAALGSCVLAAAGIGAGPAYAQENKLWISAPYETVLPGVDADGGARERSLAVQVSRDVADDTVPAGRLTVDISEIASFARVSWPTNCEPESEVRAVCDFPEMPAGTESVPAATFGLRALPGADVSASGYVRYSAVAAQATSHPAETRVGLGNGPDLGLSQTDYQHGLRPGSETSVRATLSNSGNRTAERTLLWLNASYGLRFEQRHANCEYREHHTGTSALCVLDEAVAPGQRYALSTGLDVGRKAMYERFDHSVHPYADETLEDMRGDWAWTRGTGAELDLRAVAATGAAAADPDIDPQDNHRTVMLNARNTADLKLLGSRVSGAAGDTVTARVTVHNRGPAWVASLGAGASVAKVRFQAPQGTTVMGLPEEDCWTSEDGASPTTYYCRTPIYLHDKASHTFEIPLRIDRVVRGARTTVATVNDDPELSIRKFDPNLRNNSARIVVN
ncbi:hypothetical protein AB0E64_25645 [Streptomyces caelestis]|uniref:DUF11 domain-containing protein n=1 Tax=Streptomyces caelestis TaxID=36816 RepID=A0A7W9H083_9ACTN|nr:hypothetical protein [Streptomyces caelestis]MBB5792969.1 hypothetical protein [Streptomyces caelestis]GGW64914.1 hypothetical protein GCM10010320_52840 [Streptomyces caelestis]